MLFSNDVIYNVNRSETSHEIQNKFDKFSRVHYMLNGSLRAKWPQETNSEI